MPRLQTITTNFTGGEMSPRAYGRVDLERFNASAELLRNVVVLRHGGATARPALDYKGETKTHAKESRPVPFIFSRTDAYIIELGDLYLRVWKDGLQVESSPGVPYEIATPFAEAELATLDWAQQADTMIIASGVRALKRLRRFADDSWILDDVPLSPAPMGESGERSASVNMTISATTVGSGRTLTASGAFFLAADVGRTIGWGTGLATITAVGSSTGATADVTTAFAAAAATGPAWLLGGSPMAVCTASAKDPVGAAITLTLAAAGWRAVTGRHVQINGGLARITNVSSATVVDAVIVTELASTTAVPADSWVLQGDLWNDIDGYPETVSFYQQRLWAANTAKYPQTVWGSRSGLYFDFTPGVLDDSGVYKTLDADEINVIQYMASFSALVVMTYGGEFDARGGVEKPITQTNCQITKWSRWGSDLVRPEEAGEELFFAQRGGSALRVLARGQIDGLVSRDVSVFSEHLCRAGLRSISWEQSPEQVLWCCTNDGALIALTYAAEQQVAAFASGVTDGAVEWLATVPEGSTDATYAIVRRTIGGSTKRYMERLNWDARGQDSRVSVTVGTATAAFTGFGHLIGKTVSLLADGVYVGTAVVDGSGGVTLPRAALTLSAGLPVTATIRQAAPEVGTGTGTSQGQQQSVHAVMVRLLDSIGLTINGEEVIAFRQFGEDVLDAPPQPFSGFKKASQTGWGDSAGIEIMNDQPYPFTVLGIVRHFTVNT